MTSEPLTREDYARAYSLHFQKTVRLLTSRGASREAAEEASQGAWARGWEHLAQLRNRNYLCTWINTIALNYHRKLMSSFKGKEPLSDYVATAPHSDRELDLKIILNGCAAPDRHLLNQVVNGRSISEIARDAGATDLAIRIRLSRARVRARKFATSRPLGLTA